MIVQDVYINIHIDNIHYILCVHKADAAVIIVVVSGQEMAIVGECPAQKVAAVAVAVIVVIV